MPRCRSPNPAAEVHAASSDHARVLVIMMLPGDGIVIPAGEWHAVRTRYIANAPDSARWSLLGGSLVHFWSEVDQVLSS